MVRYSLYLPLGLKHSSTAPLLHDSMIMAKHLAVSRMNLPCPSLSWLLPPFLPQSFPRLGPSCKTLRTDGICKIFYPLSRNLSRGAVHSVLL